MTLFELPSITIPSTNAERVFTDGYFKGFRFHVAVPTASAPHGVTSLEKTTERKLQVIERALVDGSDVHDFGRKGIQYSAEIVFFGKNFQNDFYQFESVLNQGTPGKLVLPHNPKSVWATFQKMTEKLSAQDGEAITVSVTWLEASSKPASNINSTGLTSNEIQLNTATETLEKISASADNLVSSLSNPLVNTIQGAINTAISIKSTVNNVIGLAETTKAQITALVKSVTSQVDLLKALANRVMNLIRGKTSSGQDQSLTNGNVSYGIDKETGATITSFSQETTSTVVQSPLTASIASVALPVPTVETEAGAELELSKVIDQLNASKADLESLSQGRTPDISAAITDLVNNLTALMVNVAPSKLTAYVVNIPMSLNEVLFFNGISVDRCDDIYKNNTHIKDVLLIDAGEVVYL